MKKRLATISVVSLMVLCLASFALAWQADRDNVEHTGDHIFGDAGYVDFRGTVKLDQTAITATAAELNILDGVTATAAELNAAADASARATTSSLTNGASLTLSASTPVVVLTGTGQGSGSTNTVTLATPYPIGVEFTLIVSSASTNLIKIADSTTVVAIGADWIGNATDTLKIYTTATNACVETGVADN